MWQETRFQRDELPGSLGRRLWPLGKVATVLRDGGRSRKGRRAGREAEPPARSGGDEPGQYLLGDRGRPSARPAPREGKAEGFLGEVARPGTAAAEERRGAPRAPELVGARERPAWALSCLRLGCCSSPGSQQVSLGKKLGLTLGPGRQEAIVAWPCRTGHRQASGGLGRALVALGTGSSFCLWEGTCCFPLFLAQVLPKQVQLRKKPRASGPPSCSL